MRKSGEGVPCGPPILKKEEYLEESACFSEDHDQHLMKVEDPDTWRAALSREQNRGDIVTHAGWDP